MRYVKLNKQNQVVGSGFCSDESFAGIQPAEGIRLVPVDDAPKDDSRKWIYQDGKFVDGGPKFEFGYSDIRRMNYPPIQEQLDMLFHAMDNGEIPKAKEFYNAIKRVKDANPKPNGK